jgi:hypothetical protein
MFSGRSGWWLGGLGTALLVGSLCFSPPSEANVYKWKDAQNRIHYTDRPPPPDGILISIETNYYAKRDASSQPSAPGRPTTPNPDSPSPAAQAALKNAVQQDVTAVRSEQCKQAQERYQSYVNTRRLFREGPNGERQYLTDAEIEEARINAKRELDEACTAAAEVR